MFVKYNPLDKFYKSVTGAGQREVPCVFRVETNASACTLILKKDGGGSSSFRMHKNENNVFEIELTLHEAGLYFYAFDLGAGLYVGLSSDYLGEITTSPAYFQYLVTYEDFIVPTQFNGGLIYQIFPDRFNVSGEVVALENRIYHKNLSDTPNFLPNQKGKILNNDFFGGNLKGITAKLDYLKSLSVTIIYLNPIFKSYSNHHYDTGDYFEIDPNLGTEADLKELIDKAGEVGIKIVLDGVFSHTGDDSRYFNKYNTYHDLGAYQSKQSPYYEWYEFTKYPDKYSSWWGIDILPQVNEANPSYDKFINGKDGVIAHYTAMGLGGWRLDVADELPTCFLQSLRKAVKSTDKDAIIIGEVWEDATNKISYGERRSYFYGDQLDSIMNYVIKDAIVEYMLDGNVEKLSYAVKEQIDHYPKASLHTLMNVLATHDTYRAISSVSGREMYGKSKSEMAIKKLSDKQRKEAVSRLKIAAALQYTMCGIPSVYYGDEIGMEGYSDPLNRKFFAWDSIDEEILSWYKKLGKIRKEVPALKNGEFEEIIAKDSIYAYARKGDDGDLITAVNKSSGTIEISFEGIKYDLLTDEKFIGKCEVKTGACRILYDRLI